VLVTVLSIVTKWRTAPSELHRMSPPPFSSLNTVDVKGMSGQKQVFHAMKLPASATRCLVNVASLFVSFCRSITARISYKLALSVCTAGPMQLPHLYLFVLLDQCNCHTCICLYCWTNATATPVFVCTAEPMQLPHLYF